MALIDKTTIVYVSNGKRRQVLVSWLLSRDAQWHMEANPFIVQDASLPSKVEGETFNGAPVKEQLIARYNNLRTIFNATDIFEHLTTETEDEPETPSVDDTEVISELSKEDELRNILDAHGIKHGRVKHVEKLQEMVNQIETK